MVKSVSVAPPDRLEELQESASEQALGETDSGWVTIVWNDPVNLMSYVSFVFQTYFGYSKGKAEKLMLAVHNEGKAVVAHGSREKMETDTAAMHGYSLWATFERDT